MRFLGLIGCLFGRHVRARGHVRHDSQDFVSICRYCHRPMVRETSGKWVLTNRRAKP